MISPLHCRDYISLLSIRTKEGKLAPLVLNEPQERYYQALAERFRAGKPVRVIVLKARQMGFSTLSEAILYWLTATAEHTDAMVIAHKEDATANLFRMTKLYYESTPEPLKPMRAASNAQELVFDRPSGQKGSRGLHSRIRCATAGGQGVGRSDTLRAVHMSEFAFWPGNKMATYTGIMQAVPDLPGTMVIIESTANGFDEFKQLWDNAVEAQRRGDEDGFMPLFFPWHEMKTYRRAVPRNFQRTEEEEKLAELYDLDDEQLSWRRWCIRNNCGGDERIFRQEYPATPDEAFLATGSCVFDQEKIVPWREIVRTKKAETGSFRFEYDGLRISEIEWQRGNGPIRIYKKPEPGVPYVIGGDIAGTGSDEFVGMVLDNRTGEQVAVLKHQQDETMYTRQMYCLGKYYNDALIGIETNYSTYPQKELERLGYKNFYVREYMDTYTGKLSTAFGFVTNSKTRTPIIDALKVVVKEALETIVDYETLGEMLTFIYDENWRMQAEVGAHDDLVMALAIAHQIRHQQRSETEVKAQTVEWSPSLLEDFERASPAEREYLIKKYGHPRR